MFEWQIYCTPLLTIFPSFPSFQWLPLPIFAVYRVLLTIYILVWLILHIVTRRDTFGPHWLIFLTDLSYALLFFAMLSLAVLCVMHTIAHYSSSKTLLKYIPKRDFPVARIYQKQDNIPWYVKIIWLLYNTACSSAILVLIGFWGFVYSPCENGTAMQSESSGNGTTDTGSGGSGSAEQCETPDVHTIQLHGVNAVLVFLDLALSRVPYQLLHFPYSTVYTAAYIIFSVVYWGAGGVNHIGQPYIYSVLDYGGQPISALFAILIVFAPIAAFLALFVLALLRDVVSVRVGCCFRDVKRLPYRDSTREDTNGISGELLSKV